ncbi:SDR family oxidoreductase [Ensifer sp. ENS07]|uniref:SDR family oxidoreductase n=1 Tax=Ensifer sp. ENS07 TaxID=2769274 RepID=UPI0017836FAA|nr:SDR family oxidoreductase [Ensifer sp. ENS07]MBD9638818.1 SDR family oxidoreductase [Ensifer sp. ENS07]
MASLEDKKVLITGALGTLGQALVARFTNEGAAVFAWDRPDAPDPQAVLDKIAGGVTFVGGDLNDLSATDAIATALADKVGGFDILVNNAAYVTNKPHEEFSIEHYEEEIRINSSAAFVLARALSKHMKAKKAGKIVCITSLTLTGHWEGFVPYIASKGAMYGLVKGLSRELGHHGINVNGVNPGAIVSEAEWRHFGEKREEYHRWILERQCLKRRIEPVDVANLVFFLASPQADLITGQDVHCDGGW